MELSARQLGPYLVVDISEQRIDAAIAIAFKDAVRDIGAKSSADVILNLEAVKFIDSSGLGAIVAVMKSLGSDRRLHLACLSPAVEKVFRLTRMDSVFTIHPAPEAALNGHEG